MQATPWVIICCCLALTPCAAQEPEPDPWVEFFGGYSYARADVTGIAQNRISLNGWNASITGNTNRWFGFKFDFAGHYGTSKIAAPGVVCPPTCLPAFRINNHAHEFLFGPQFTYRTNKIAPFAHVLFGLEHVSARTNLPLPLPLPPFSVSTSQNGFAVAVGGGFDISMSKRFAWRTQSDYLMTRLFGRTENNLRVSTGIVARF